MSRPPLAGLRVLTVSQFGAGPFGTQVLADLGADVIKIEDPTVGGDIARYVPPFRDGRDSLYFQSFNRGKKSITLDLRRPDAAAVRPRRLHGPHGRAGRPARQVRWRGDLPEKLGLTYATLSAVNPAVVCCSLSGFGRTGPRAAEPAYDYLVQPCCARWPRRSRRPARSRARRPRPRWASTPTACSASSCTILLNASPRCARPASSATSVPRRRGRDTVPARTFTPSLQEDTPLRPLSRLLIAALVVAVLAPPAHAWFRTPATQFATLPPGAKHPEGITVDEHGNVYVTTFGAEGTSSGTGQMFVFNKHGRLLREVNVAGSSTLLLDLAFHPTSGHLLVLDFGASKVLTVDPVSGASSVFSDISAGPQPGLNVLTFDRAGNVYVSASFAGAEYKIGPHGGAATTWVQSDLLKTTGVPPFGANGLAFNRAQTTLFVNNTGNDTVVKIPVNADGTAGAPAVFVNAINGADGLIIDEHDNLWIAANQADEIGLLFPASLVFSGPFVYVTNLAIDLRLFGAANATGDSPWTADVKVHTIARIPAFIPPVRGLPRH